jgi:hypothetical protein
MEINNHASREKTFRNGIEAYRCGPADDFYHLSLETCSSIHPSRLPRGEGK